MTTLLLPAGPRHSSSSSRWPNTTASPPSSQRSLPLKASGQTCRLRVEPHTGLSALSMLRGTTNGAGTPSTRTSSSLAQTARSARLLAHGGVKRTRHEDRCTCTWRYGSKVASLKQQSTRQTYRALRHVASAHSVQMVSGNTRSSSGLRRHGAISCLTFNATTADPSATRRRASRAPSASTTTHARCTHASKMAGRRCPRSTRQPIDGITSATSLRTVVSHPTCPSGSSQAVHR